MNDGEKWPSGRRLAMMLHIYLFVWYFSNILRWPLLCIISDGSRNIYTWNTNRTKMQKVTNRYSIVVSFFLCGVYNSISSSIFQMMVLIRRSVVYGSFCDQRERRWPSNDLRITYIASCVGRTQTHAYKCDVRVSIWFSISLHLLYEFVDRASTPQKCYLIRYSIAYIPMMSMRDETHV